MHNKAQRQQLHDIAYDSIKSGVTSGKALSIDLSKMNTALNTKRATFVTLQKHGELRGCIGMLEPIRPLAEDVAHNAFAAAFSDPRFSPLQAHELEQLDIHISILGTPEKMLFDSEDDLLTQIRPNIDGLIMEEGQRRGTFLPSVWQSVQDKKEFLNHLKMKSGLASNYWSNSIKIQRYTVEEF
ncbi:MAG: AmmeMemoRadiSam system protein A [Gammaproteobacteria bacterium]|nr:AmmeMemoRadiSam system protein A [Gammaproteobacteria bacterium]